MNSLSNAILLTLFFPILAISIIVGFNFPLEFIRTSGENIPYKDVIFLVLAVMVFVVAVNRCVKRWMGLGMANKTNRFKFSTPISKERRIRVIVYTLLESLVLSVIALALYTLTPDSLPCVLAYGIFAVDNLLFLSIGNRKFRVSMSSKALLVADREVSVLYFNGLRKISISQQTLYFDYIKELQLSFPMNCLPDQERKAFVESLESVVDKEKVLLYNLGEWKK
jgi:hypothetical protein